MKLAIVDIETTGTRPTYDAITEIAVMIVEDRCVLNEWQTLLQPGSHIPLPIQQLTGITNEMVEHAPCFDEVADELYELLQDCIFVAHNARFDYGFIKNAFKKVGIDFQSKVLCTVKLSRQLYPRYKRHNLDSLIQRFSLQADARHRAMADVVLVYQFLLQVFAEHDIEKVSNCIQGITKKSSLPSRLKTKLSDIPNTPGVYLFYAENTELPIYIGKSINLRTRVQSHFSSDYTSSKELNISQQVAHIEWIETAGELGALLLESRLVKEKMPIYNRKLRRVKNIFSFKIKPIGGYQGIEIVQYDANGRSENVYGAFRSQRAATKALTALVEDHQLCAKLCHLEKTKKSCFAYQLKKCRGACIENESAKIYNLRVEIALSAYRQQSWPFKGPIGIKEYCAKNDKSELHVIHDWRHLKTLQTQDELSEMPLGDIDAYEDVDSMKIIQQFINKHREKLAIIEL